MQGKLQAPMIPALWIIHHVAAIIELLLQCIDLASRQTKGGSITYISAVVLSLLSLSLALEVSLLFEPIQFVRYHNPPFILFYYHKVQHTEVLDQHGLVNKHLPLCAASV